MPEADLHVLCDLRHIYATMGKVTRRLDPATLARRMGNSVQTLWKHYAGWWEDLSPQGRSVLSDGDGFEELGWDYVGTNGNGDGALPWETNPCK